MRKRLFKEATKLSLLLCVVSFALFTASAGADYSAKTVDEYNAQLPYWGTSWRPDTGNRGGYHPSFYTGFAPRSEFANRIHIRQARGNQTRVSIPLDEQTVIDYMYDLLARDAFYTSLQASGKLKLVSESKAIPHVKLFSQVVNSDVYKVKESIAQLEAGNLSVQEFYSKSLNLISDLNKGRVFNLNINLTAEFLKWREFLKANATSSKYLADSDNQTIAIETLLLGRINYTDKPTKEILELLEDAVELAFEDDKKAFLLRSKELFLALTGTKYKFSSLVSGKLLPAIQCGDLEKCKLVYPEFSAIYPTGSAKYKRTDGRGNSIPALASPGLWVFFKHYSGRGVDNIRNESYYGWVPKMDYEKIGNGFHNPGMRFFPPSYVKKKMSIPSNHSTYWAVKRGAVSSGCSRLAAGHAWELRGILPVINSEVNKVHVFINDTKDFDLYDVDGDGELELMGVDYLIRFSAKSASGSGKREVSENGFQADPKMKSSFYKNLYGSRGVFEQNDKGDYFFVNPSISLQSYRDFEKKSVRTSLTIEGKFPLYEQSYEKDKIQFYKMNPNNESFIQAMGRVKGAAPAKFKSGNDFTNKSAEEFQKQAEKLGLIK